MLDAALWLIGEQGLHAVTMRDVAGRAGVSLGSASYHFPDREALMVAALKAFATEEIERCDAVIAAWQDRELPAETILAAMIAEVERTFTRPGVAVAQLELYVAASRNPTLAETARDCIAAYERLVARALVATGAGHAESRRRAGRIVALADGYALHAAAVGRASLLPSDFADAVRAIALAPE